jgi:hypothetical protein
VPRAGEAKRAPVECCRDFMALSAEQRREWRWQALHQLAHSRTTFSPATFADIARLGPKYAGHLIDEAERMRWIWTPAEGVWVGRLTPKRR